MKFLSSRSMLAAVVAAIFVCPILPAGPAHADEVRNFRGDPKCPRVDLMEKVFASSEYRYSQDLVAMADAGCRLKDLGKVATAFVSPSERLTLAELVAQAKNRPQHDIVVLRAVQVSDGVIWDRTIVWVAYTTRENISAIAGSAASQ